MTQEWRLIRCQDGTQRLVQDDGAVTAWLHRVETGKTQPNHTLHGPIIGVARVVIAHTDLVTYGLPGSPALPLKPQGASPLPASDTVSVMREYLGPSAPPPLL